MYRRPLIPRLAYQPDLDMELPVEMVDSPDEVTFEVTGGSVRLVVPPDCPDDAVFDQECPYIYCELCLEDKFVLEAWIPEDAPYLMIRKVRAGEPVCGTGWGP